IVRGTTQTQLVRMLREAGATEVHLRIASPPIQWPCFYGIDMSSRGELLAANLPIGEIESVLAADSLAYLSLEGLLAAIDAPGAGFCAACWTGSYPTAVPVNLSKSVLEKSQTG
ncbi:MAG: amidophosphoribosyltransferase, partial [Actinobacteria bacterium]|nr:amidophosphoribosyltransferase [Actinomycetota bacterium]